MNYNLELIIDVSDKKMYMSSEVYNSFTGGAQTELLR